MAHQAKAALWTDVQLRQVARPGDAATARPRSVVLCDLSPQTATLWRNAPSHPPLLISGQQRKSTPLMTTASSAVSFQQSLRSYPLPHVTQPKCAIQSAKMNQTALLHKDAKRSAMSSQPPSQSAVPRDDSRCHVTNLDGEQSTPFFLDYLDSQSFNENPMDAPIGAFNHRHFMEMFREPDSSSGGVDRCSMPESGSLPYAVNNDLKPVDRTSGGRSGVDSLVSDASDQSFCRAAADSAIQRRIAARGGAFATAITKCSGKENVVFRRNSSQAMENKNSRSNSNLNQRLQIVAERRAQIEEAKRERVQRQIEQVTRTAPAPQMNSGQNPSVAFGSTRPRNIDLTRPLVTPIPSARPKSEIFSGSFYGGHLVPDSSPAPVYSKDDANYQPRTPRPATTLQSTPSLMTQSMSVSSMTPHYRAVRRHDPELVPAMQKYIFRDYAVPSSSGTPSLRKENSMISSMTSTKSFQASSVYRTPFGGPQNRPKKSFSMNRLDQLAQPRRRIEPKVPTSASFVRSKEPITSRKPASATEGESRGAKPAPPPKTLFKSPKLLPNELGSGSGSSSRPATTPKPRPLSQIELSTQFVPAEEKPTEGEKEPEGNEADRLAEYKRALAEKRAMYRKQQEEQQQTQPIRKAKIVKPEPPTNVEEVEEEKEEHRSSSSSSSSSSASSDSDSEIDEPKPSAPPTATANNEQPKEQSPPVASVAELEVTALVAESVAESVIDSASESVVDPAADSQSEQLISFGNSDPLLPRNVYENLMTTSLTGDLANLSISSEQDKALANASMTGSFDSSLLTSAANLGSSQRPQSKTLTKEQLEERSALLLQKEKIEREKRKNRVQEILKRTRKEEKKNEGKGSESASNSNGDSSQSENESPGSSEETTSNGVSKYNGLNGDSSKTENGHSNGHINSTHHRDMKNYVSENEQSLPPTNGF